VLAVDWETYPLVAGIIVTALIVGALVIRAVMPIKFDVTVRERPREPETGTSEQPADRPERED